MSTPAVLALALGMLLVGAVLGWLWRGAICRRRHAHLTAAYEPARLDTLLHETTAADDAPAEAAPAPADEPPAEATAAEQPAVEAPGSRPAESRPAGDGPTEVAPEAAREVAPGPDGASPDPAYVVKGKRTSRIYHLPGSPAYARTRADVWFRTAEDAEAAGFRAPKQRGG